MSWRAVDLFANALCLLACVVLAALILPAAWWKGWPVWYLPR